VDAIGLSILSGAHMPLMEKTMALLEEEGMTDVPVFLGGIIPDADAARLHAIGVTGIFGPGADIDEITQFIWGAIRDDG
jgi:methylmalonyl-CoA mutase C-terminal domain/subunit